MPRELLAKSYEPNEFEQKWYGFWEKEGFFLADADSEKAPLFHRDPPAERDRFVAHGARVAAHAA